MPIEIRELVIKATIQDAPVEDLAGSTLTLSLSTAEQEALIKAIAEKVMELMESRRDEVHTGFLPASFDISPTKREFPI
jgi:hypothetical protein